MIEKLLAMFGLNPEQFQAQIERVQSEAVAVVRHFDSKTTALEEGQRAIARALTTVIENQQLLFQLVQEIRGDVHHVNGAQVAIAYDDEADAEQETVQ
mgnify:CR=1 FL=1